MLKDILVERNLSVYRVSKDTGIAYSTLNDIVIDKKDIKKASAELLYRLAKYLNLSMEVLYENASKTNAMSEIKGEAISRRDASRITNAPYLSIWWWTGDRIIGVTKDKQEGSNIDGLIHYSDTENHVTLWKKVLMDNYSSEEFKQQYEKGFKSLYRGRVYYDPRTACYEITCSKNIIDNDRFRNAIIEYCNLKNVRKEFVALHHYEYIRELSGNVTVDADYYESSY